VENLSEHRDRANKMVNELRTTLSSETTLLLIRSSMMSIEIISQKSDLIDSVVAVAPVARPAVAMRVDMIRCVIAHVYFARLGPKDL
jgi:hypothetical protein